MTAFRWLKKGRSTRSRRSCGSILRISPRSAWRTAATCPVSRVPRRGVALTSDASVVGGYPLEISSPHRPPHILVERKRTTQADENQVGHQDVEQRVAFEQPRKAAG